MGVWGKVVSIQSERMEKTLLEIETTEISERDIQKSKIMVVLPYDSYDYFYGDTIFVSGKIKIPDELEESNFSYPLYLKGKGIYSLLTYPEVKKPELGEKSLKLDLYEKIYREILFVREKCRNFIQSSLKEPDGSIVSAFIIGDQGTIPENIRNDFGRIGIIHILSVSGAHVTLLIFILAWISNQLFSRKIFKLILTVVFVSFYLVLSGSPSCALRSGIMGIFAFLAIYQNRLANIKTMLWLSCAILLWQNPLLLVSDIGFELSFLAVFGMTYIYLIFDKLLLWGKEGFFWKVIKIVVLSISVEIAVLPLVFYYFGFISLISPLANILLLPLFSFLIPLGFLIVIVKSLECFFIFYGVMELPLTILRETIALSTHFLMFLVDKSASMLAKIPLGSFDGKIKIGFIVLYYSCLFLMVIVYNLVYKNRILLKKLDYFCTKEFLGEETENILKKEKIPGFWQKVGGRIRLQKKIFSQAIDSKEAKIKVFWLIVACFLWFFSLVYLYSSSRPASVVALDVGQGDAILFNFPAYHFQMLVDGGPGRRVLPPLGEFMPFYDDKIEMVFLSHEHQDHVEGLLDVLERYQVSSFFLPKTPSQNSSDLYKKLWEKIREKNIPILKKKQGDEINLQFNGKVCKIRFLSPFYDYGLEKLNNINNESMVLEIDFSKKILLTGDAEQGLMKALLYKSKDSLKADILKVSHHGSRISAYNSFLEAVKPKTALISVGKDNQFGHPSSLTVSRLVDLGAKVRRTDLEGSIETNF